VDAVRPTASRPRAATSTNDQRSRVRASVGSTSTDGGIGARQWPRDRPAPRERAARCAKRWFGQLIAWPGSVPRVEDVPGDGGSRFGSPLPCRPARICVTVGKPTSPGWPPSQGDRSDVVINRTRARRGQRRRRRRATACFRIDSRPQHHAVPSAGSNLLGNVRCAIAGACAVRTATSGAVRVHSDAR
jgi:hypothetical protein